jgi:hypothetical protein
MDGACSSQDAESVRTYLGVKKKLALPRQMHPHSQMEKIRLSKYDSGSTKEEQMFQKSDIFSEKYFSRSVKEWVHMRH